VHPGAEFGLYFDKDGYPSIRVFEGDKVTHHATEQLRSRFQYEEFPDVEKPTVEKSDLGFEKFSDEEPFTFKVAGVQGEAIYHSDLEGGLGTIEMHHVMVDKGRVAQYLNPDYKNSLASTLSLGGDKAALAVAEERAYQIVEDYAAHEALYEDLMKRGLGDSPMAKAVQARMGDIANEGKTAFPEAHIFRQGASDLSVPLETAGSVGVETDAATVGTFETHYAAMDPAMIKVESLKFPESWDVSQQEAARKAIEFQQEYARSLAAQFEAYLEANPDSGSISHLQAFTEREIDNRLTGDDYSIADILRRIDQNEDGQPTDAPPIKGRRRSEFITPVPKPRKRRRKSDPKQTVFDLQSGDGISSEEQEYNPTPIINEIRAM